MAFNIHGRGLAMGMCGDCLLGFKQGEVLCVMTTCSVLFAFFARDTCVATRRQGRWLLPCEIKISPIVLLVLLGLNDPVRPNWMSSPVDREREGDTRFQRCGGMLEWGEGRRHAGEGRIREEIFGVV